MQPSPSAGPLPSLTIANRTFTDLSNLKCLFGNTGNTAGQRYSSLRDVSSSSSSAYQVPVGKTFKVKAVRVVVYVSGGATAVAVGGCDNDVGNASSTVPTNQTKPASSSATATWSTGTFEDAIQDFGVAAGKFLFADTAGLLSANIMVWGYEQ